MAAKIAQFIKFLFLLAMVPTRIDGEPIESSDCKEIQVSAENSSQTFKAICDPTTNQLPAIQKTPDGQQFCIDAEEGKILLGPSVDVLSCECLVKAAEARRAEKNPDYTPQCDAKTGQYAVQQCSRIGDCWCADALGTQLGPKWNSKEKVIDLSRPHSGARLSCEEIRNVFSPKSKTSVKKP